MGEKDSGEGEVKQAVEQALAKVGEQQRCEVKVVIEMFEGSVLGGFGLGSDCYFDSVGEWEWSAGVVHEQFFVGEDEPVLERPDSGLLPHHRPARTLTAFELLRVSSTECLLCFLDSKTRAASRESRSRWARQCDSSQGDEARASYG